MNDSEDALTDDAFERAKQPEALIAGPYGHPLHAAMVTVPIGAWVTSFVFDTLSYLGPEESPYRRASRDAMLVGIAGAGVAASLGFLDWLRLTVGTRVWVYGTVHMVLNFATTGFYASAATGRAQDLERRVGLGALLGHAAALGVLGLSGIVGGELSYRYGVRVADEATQRRGYVRRA